MHTKCGTMTQKNPLIEPNTSCAHELLCVLFQGMVEAAVYIRREIQERNLLTEAFNFDVPRGSREYDLVVVGHSLGAGTAAILAILMREHFPELQCFAFSPPGGLMSASCVEQTKSFITSVVVGKDVVPR